jgi:hypothetical protein
MLEAPQRQGRKLQLGSQTAIDFPEPKLFFQQEVSGNRFKIVGGKR